MAGPVLLDIVSAKTSARQVARASRSAAWAEWTRRGSDAAGMALAGQVDAVIAQARQPGVASPVLTVSAYVAMRTELDPLPLLAALGLAGHRTALPVVVARETPLLFRAWTPGDALVPAGFGTREPAPGQPAVEPDLLLVPLLAFDRAGFRLGYGGGYYDRTLARLRARSDGTVTAIGIAFDAQEVDAVPHLDYDQRLDGILTPSGLVRIVA